MSELLPSHMADSNRPHADSLAEQLSALMDGELARDEMRFLMRGIEAQSDLGRRWSNFHVIGASLRREFVAVALPANFADGVLAQLDAQGGLAAASPARRIGFGVLRWVGGGAIAAAVAVVALTTLRPLDNPRTPGAAVAEQSSPSNASSAAYLPLARPLLNTNSPVFDYNAVRQASFEQLVPNDYIAPERVELLPNRIVRDFPPYVVRLPTPPAPASATPAPR